MAGLPFSDTFTGADGSAWSSSWTAHNVTGTNNITSNRGQMNAPATISGWVRMDLTGVTMSTNFDISFDFYLSAPATTGNYSPLNIFVNSDGSNTSGQAPSNGYYFYFFPNNLSYNSLLLYKMTSGTATGLNNQGFVSNGANQPYSMRIRYQPNTFSFKLWNTTQTESASWGTYAVGSAITTGQISVSLGGNATAAYNGYIENFYVFDPTVQTTTPGRVYPMTVSSGDQSGLAYFTTPPWDGGSAITGYTALVNPGGLVFSSPTSPMYLNGLVNGTAYTVTVAANNANGTGISSQPYTFTPQNPGGTPGAWGFA